jgi:hypothetical protein
VAWLRDDWRNPDRSRQHTERFFGQGDVDEKIANRAITCVEREKRRHFHLTE